MTAMKQKILIYDFDGVICDSVGLKTDAFVELYNTENESIQKLVREYHLANGGISRFSFGLRPFSSAFLA